MPLMQAEEDRDIPGRVYLAKFWPLHNTSCLWICAIFIHAVANVTGANAACAPAELPVPAPTLDPVFLTLILLQ
jgi:hypothetical protein